MSPESKRALCWSIYFISTVCICMSCYSEDGSANLHPDGPLLWADARPHPHGRTGQRRQDHCAIQAQAGGGCHNHPHCGVQRGGKSPY